MRFEEWIEAMDNVERNCGVCGEPKCSRFIVCDNCYEDMRYEINNS